MNTAKTRKEIALDFLLLCAKGESKKAFNSYVGPEFKHHNVYFKGDAESLMIAMEENAKRNPHKLFEVQRALEDGHLVAVHSRVRPNPSDAGVAVIHIFKFDQNTIVEMWDFGQPVPTEMVNENGMF
jgi:predicted SnoaL-like aldol condensation-catalyzing enzyme